MPMLTTFRICLPVWPFHSPERTFCENAPIRSSTWCTPGTTSTPSTVTDAERGWRSAVCSTARPSDTLILSPRNIASMCSRSPDSAASCRSRVTVSSVIRFLE